MTIRANPATGFSHAMRSMSVEPTRVKPKRQPAASRTPPARTKNLYEGGTPLATDEMARALSSCSATSVNAIRRIDTRIVLVIRDLHSKQSAGRAQGAQQFGVEVLPRTLWSAAAPGIAAVLTGPAGVATPPYESTAIYRAARLRLRAVAPAASASELVARIESAFAAGGLQPARVTIAGIDAVVGGTSEFRWRWIAATLNSFLYVAAFQPGSAASGV